MIITMIGVLEMMDHYDDRGDGDFKMLLEGPTSIVTFYKFLKLSSGGV